MQILWNLSVRIINKYYSAKSTTLVRTDTINYKSELLAFENQILNISDNYIYDKTNLKYRYAYLTIFLDLLKQTWLYENASNKLLEIFSEITCSIK